MIVILSERELSAAKRARVEVPALSLPKDLAFSLRPSASFASSALFISVDARAALLLPCHDHVLATGHGATPSRTAAHHPRALRGRALRLLRRRALRLRGHGLHLRSRPCPHLHPGSSASVQRSHRVG